MIELPVGAYVIAGVGAVALVAYKLYTRITQDMQIISLLKDATANSDIITIEQLSATAFGDLEDELIGGDQIGVNGLYAAMAEYQSGKKRMTDWFQFTICHDEQTCMTWVINPVTNRLLHQHFKLNGKRSLTASVRHSKQLATICEEPYVMWKIGNYK